MARHNLSLSLFVEAIKNLDITLTKEGEDPSCATREVINLLKSVIESLTKSAKQIVSSFA